MRELRKPKAGAEAGEGAAADASSSDGAAAPVGRAQQRAKKADAYHARHPEWVAEFNALTHGECAGGPAGVQWAAVRAWQQKHWQVNGLVADGLVGPKTLDAAKVVAGRAKKGDGGDAEEKGDAAEASADKPKLDEDASDEAGAAPHQTPAPGGGGDERKDGAIHATDFDAKIKTTVDFHQALATEGGAAPGSGPKGDDAKISPPAPQHVGGGGPGKDGGTEATLEDFDRQLHAIDQLLATFKPPTGQGPMVQSAMARADGKPVADPSKEATPRGAMMAHLESYRSAVAKLIPRWGDLSMEQRAEELTAALNAALASEHVPAVDHKLAQLQEAGHFHAETWTIVLSTQRFGAKTMSADEIDGAASDVFHEGRHAEQRFEIVRLLATQGKTAEQIRAETGIKHEVIEQGIALAKQQPLDAKSAEGKDAEGFYEDAIVNSKEHGAIERLAPQIAEAGARARATFDALPPDAQAIVAARWQDYRARMYQVIDAYERLATERDAKAAEAQLGLGK